MCVEKEGCFQEHLEMKHQWSSALMLVLLSSNDVTIEVLKPHLGISFRKVGFWQVVSTSLYSDHLQYRLMKHFIGESNYRASFVDLFITATDLSASNSIISSILFNIHVKGMTEYFHEYDLHQPFRFDTFYTRYMVIWTGFYMLNSLFFSYHMSPWVGTLKPQGIKHFSAQLESLHASWSIASPSLDSNSTRSDIPFNNLLTVWGIWRQALTREKKRMLLLLQGLYTSAQFVPT